MTALLQFKDVSKSFPAQAGPSRPVLSGVSFEARAGQKIAIVGRSGSGKSTLLHLAAGIDVPSAGEVWMNGNDISRLSEARRTLLRRDHVGLVFQFFYLLPHLSVADNAALPDLIAGAPKKEWEPRVRALLRKVGLDDRRDDLAQQLSGGEMQRVALCRALLRRPQLLLADEPTGSLDDDNSRAVMKLLFALADENGSALVYATHSRDLAALADEAWEIRHGRLERA
jgi:ABC-type lipoprotein export system ATPase subunit